VKRVLVVDDSAIVREAERQLLAARGYTVDVAVDGMDGWQAVRRGGYDLLVSDIDMPRMNGLELVRAVGADPAPRSVPGGGEAALAAVRRRRPDVVLTDMQMPVMNGLELVAALRADFPGLPVVLCAGVGSEELAVEALRAGAAHYVPKRRLTADAVPVLEEI